MLVELSIANYALIDSLRLQLGPGFNVLTGETGAGKSIILGALGLLLGDRAEGAMVRSGEHRAYVEGVFELSREAAAGVGELVDLDVAQDGLILSRDLSATGPSVCRLNGRAVPLRTLAQVGALIVDIHGQGEHLSLLRPAAQLDLLDRYAGLGGLRKRMSGLVSELVEVRARLAESIARAGQREARAELLSFQASEIAAARLVPGEDLALNAERTLLLNARRALELAREASGALEQDLSEQVGAIELIARAVRSLAALEQLAPALAPQRRSAQSAALELQEVVRELNEFVEGLQGDDHRLEQIQDRLERISSLKRKYGTGIEQILAFEQSASRELQEQRQGGRALQELGAREALLTAEASELASELSQHRMAAACRLTAEVETQLAGLGMPGSRLAVAMRQQHDDTGLPMSPGGPGAFGGVIESGRALPSGDAPPYRLRFNAGGVDRVEFLIGAHQTESLKPLASTASGGETSRLMLALKGALIQADPVPTLVFDEIDSGIGGRIGEAVGLRLWALGRRHQVLAVTHLPQIASFADLHLSVRKVAEGARMVTTVIPVQDGDRVAEVSAMLGSDSRATRQKAEELLAQNRSKRAGGT